ncbi:hypothetical protein FDECE_12011 [Fusarium decemcellulare]|nr:hypothetical protein FDECE_12011 [Fusarium decemcellulare]
MHFTRLLPIVYFAAHGQAAGGIPNFCTWEPKLPVEAGSDLSVKIENPWGEKCRAELEFSDARFSKMAWSFTALDCVDLQLAEFTVPSGAPNGDAYLTWQCDGDSPMTCIHIVITNSKGGLVLPTPQPKTETARCVPSTTFFTHTFSKDKPTGVFLDTRLFGPTSATGISTPTPITTGVTTPTISTKPWIKTPGYSSLIGTGGTRRGTSLLSTDASTVATPITTIATITIPTIIPVETTNSDPPTTTLDSTVTTNEPSYVTVTTTVSMCPTSK